MALATSPAVLQSALGRSGIAELDPVRRCPDPGQWLRDHLRIETSKDSEVIRLSLRGYRPGDIVRILDAVAASYCSQVEARHREEMMQKYDEFEARRQKLETDLAKARKASAEILARGDDLPLLDEEVRRQLLLSEIDFLGRQRAAVIADRLATSADAEAAQRIGEAADARRAARLEVLDRQAAELASDIDGVVRRLADLTAVSATLGSRRAEIEDLEEALRRVHSLQREAEAELTSKAPLRMLDEAMATELGWWERLTR